MGKISKKQRNQLYAYIVIFVNMLNFQYIGEY
jgi:hypothetical protein